MTDWKGHVYERIEMAGSARLDRESRAFVGAAAATFRYREPRLNVLKRSAQICAVAGEQTVED